MSPFEVPDAMLNHQSPSWTVGLRSNEYNVFFFLSLARVQMIVALVLALPFLRLVLAPIAAPR